jgi:alanine racemase
VVKADAYGHGAVAVARALAPLSDALAVSLVEEGLELRSAGVRLPIVVLGAFYNRHQDDVIHESLTPVIYDEGDLQRFAAASSRRGGRLALHLKVDTGMSRLGFSIDALPAALAAARDLGSLEIAGLCTHLASADLADREVTDGALGRFADCVALARRQGLGRLENHAANSAAAVRFPAARLDAVRPGLALYGAMPSAEVTLPGLEPALRLTTRIMALHEIAPGTPVSYGGVWRAARRSRVATLPIGYADGYPRHVRGAVTLVRGVRAPVVGTVCMDMTMVDVTDVPGAALGDAVTLIGRDAGESITVDDLAAWAGTINYEILCGVSKRVPRIYTGAIEPGAEPPAPSK